MEAGLAGDLIMTGTPTKQPVCTMREDPVSETSLREDEQMSRVTIEDTGTIYEVSIPGHYDDAFRLRFRSTSPIQQIASYIRQRCEELEANKEDIDRVVQVSSSVIYGDHPSCVYLAACNLGILILISMHSHFLHALRTLLFSILKASTIREMIRFSSMKHVKTFPYRLWVRNPWATISVRITTDTINSLSSTKKILSLYGSSACSHKPCSGPLRSLSHITATRPSTLLCISLRNYLWKIRMILHRLLCVAAWCLHTMSRSTGSPFSYPTWILMKPLHYERSKGIGIDRLERHVFS